MKDQNKELQVSLEETKTLLEKERKAVETLQGDLNKEIQTVENLRAEMAKQAVHAQSLETDWSDKYDKLYKVKIAPRALLKITRKIKRTERN